jgi:pyruvate,water dikinase
VTDKLILWLKDIQKEDHPLVGGKAANLGDLARGLDVPPGFCLTSEAYRQHIGQQNTGERLQEVLVASDNANIEAANDVSRRISALITGLPIPDSIGQAVAEAYYKLTAGRSGVKVAVRSSATAEDLADASFAGQQETFLNIEGLEATLGAVKKCWASLWTPRAIHYRTKKDFSHDDVAMAVIIQEMIQAEISGVMFTANPTNNNRREVLIEAAPGLGEALVSGEVRGDIYVLRRHEETHTEITSKDIADPARGQLLNDFDIRKLAHTGLKIELYYEDFQDIEWAYHKGNFYFLQTRPITTLADEEPPDIPWDSLNKVQKAVMKWVAERFPEPIHPIDGIVVKALLMAQFDAMQSFGYKIPPVIDYKRVEKGIFPEFFSPPDIKKGVWHWLHYLQLKKILQSDPAAEWKNEQVYLNDVVQKLRGRDMAKLPWELVIDYLTETLHHFHYFIVMRYRYFTLNRIPSDLLKRLLKKLFGDGGLEIFENILAGEHNITMEINDKLRELALSTRRRPEVARIIIEGELSDMRCQIEKAEGGQAFLEEFDRFLEAYGERETSMGLGGIACETWQDVPDVVFGIMRAMLTEDEGARAAKEAAAGARRKDAEKKLAQALERGIWKILGIKRWADKLIAHGRSFTVFRENSHYDVTRWMHVLRLLYFELGNRLVRRGLLQDYRDIFYLNFFEIKDMINTIYLGIEELKPREVQSLIEKRKAQQERRLARWRMRGVKVDTTGALKGVVASSGAITGAARIIRDARDFHRLKKGDILVAQYTNPAWTPLFSTAAGLVADTGGAASHAAIIAREYGLPAVMGVGNATEVLRDGEMITVDGYKGLVFREEPGTEERQVKEEQESRKAAV